MRLNDTIGRLTKRARNCNDRKYSSSFPMYEYEVVFNLDVSQMSNSRDESTANDNNSYQWRKCFKRFKYMAVLGMTVGNSKQVRMLLTHGGRRGPHIYSLYCVISYKLYLTYYKCISEISTNINEYTKKQYLLCTYWTGSGFIPRCYRIVCAIR